MTTDVPQSLIARNPPGPTDFGPASIDILNKISRGMNLRETFATNLRRLRNAKGWSQDELAFEAKINLSQLEHSGYYVSTKIVGRLVSLHRMRAELLANRCR